MILTLTSVRYKICAEETRDESAIALYNSGYEHYKNFLYIEAAELLKKAIKINPYYFECYNLLGEVYYKSDMPDSALQYFNIALKYDKNYDTALFNLSKVYNSLKLYDTALKIITDAISTAPDNIDYRYIAMDLNLKLKNDKEFLKEFQFVEKTAPDNCVGKYLFGKYLEKKGKDIEAIEYYKKTLENLRSGYNLYIPQPHLALAKIYLKLDDIDNAAANYTTVINEYKQFEKNKLNIIFYETQRAYNYSEILVNYRDALTNSAKIKFHLEYYDDIIKMFEYTSANPIDDFHIASAYYKKAMDLLSVDKTEASLLLLKKSLFHLKKSLNRNFDDELTRYMIEKILARSEEINSQERNNYAEYRKLCAMREIYDNGRELEMQFDVNRSILLNPQEKSNRDELAKFYQRKGWLNYAAEQYSRMLEIKSDDIESKDNLEALKYRIEGEDKTLNQFTQNNREKSMRLKIAVKISTPLVNILHSSVGSILEEWLTTFSEIIPRYEFYFIPRQYNSMTEIEQYSRTIDADAVLYLQIEEKNNETKTKIRIYNITETKNIPVFSPDKLRQSPDMKFIENTIKTSGKRSILKNTAEIIGFLNNSLGVYGFVKEIDRYKIIINLGSIHGLNKGDKLTIVSKNADSNIQIGEAKIEKINEYFCICDIDTPKLLNTVKPNDLAIKLQK